MIKRAILFSLIFAGVPALANDCKQSTEACAAIFADRICGEINRNGESTTLKINGTIDAKTGGLIKKIAASAGLSGNYNEIINQFENAPHGEIANELKDTRNCRQKMAMRILDIY